MASRRIRSSTAGAVTGVPSGRAYEKPVSFVPNRLIPPVSSVRRRRSDFFGIIRGELRDQCRGRFPCGRRFTSDDTFDV
jgi:hypothetical protein